MKFSSFFANESNSLFLSKIATCQEGENEWPSKQNNGIITKWPLHHLYSCLTQIDSKKFFGVLDMPHWIPFTPNTYSLAYDLAPQNLAKERKCKAKLRTSHNVWKLLKMSHFNFSILSFSTNFCPIKIDLSGNTSSFSKLAKLDLF